MSALHTSAIYPEATVQISTTGYRPSEKWKYDPTVAVNFSASGANFNLHLSPKDALALAQNITAAAMHAEPDQGDRP
jgi:hypothetical protein